MNCFVYKKPGYGTNKGDKKSLWYLVLKKERQIAIQAVGWVACHLFIHNSFEVVRTKLVAGPTQGPSVD